MNRREFVKTVVATGATLLGLKLANPKATGVDIAWFRAAGPKDTGYIIAEARWRPVFDELIGEWRKDLLTIKDGAAWFPGTDIGVVLR